MQWQIRVATTLTLLLIIPEQQSGQITPGHGLTQQEKQDSYAIYSMLLRRDVLYTHTKILGIREETIMPEGHAEGEALCLPQPEPKQVKTYQPLIDDFVRRGKDALKLKRKFDVPEYRLITASQERVVAWKHPSVPPPPGTPWPPETDPQLDGIEFVYRLSAVGFSDDRKRALVYIETRSGGQYYFLVKRSSEWIIDRNYRGDVCSWVV